MWRNWTLLILTGAIVAGGCAGRYIKKGDAAMLADRPDQALVHYRRALEKDAGLVERAEFLVKLDRAKAHVAYLQGQRLAERGKWDAAIVEFQRAIGTQVDFKDARTALATARRKASTQCHARALRLADEGKLNEAILQLKRALELDPDNADAREALDSVRRNKAVRAGRAEQLHAKAVALQAEKRWAQAATALRDAVAANANHLPSRVGLYRCNQTLHRARRLHAEGARLLAAKRLDKAIASFQQAVSVWPFFEAAVAKRDRANARRSRAKELLAKGQLLAAGLKWDDAVAAAKESVSIFPFHAESQKLLTRARKQAGEMHYARAVELVGAGKLDAAEREFLAALRHQPGMVRAAEGLAAVYSTWADKAAAGDRWGRALLWYKAATGRSKAGGYAVALARARAAVHDRIGFAMAVQVSPTPGARVTASELRSSLMPAMAAARGDFLTVAGAKAGRADYAVDVKPSSLIIQTQLVRTEHRTHQYVVRRQVPNPEIRRLSVLLRAAQRELSHLEARWAVACGYCGGTGRITCGYRRAWSNRGRANDCKYCRGTGYVTCSRCRGSGRRWRVDEWRLQRKRREAHDLRQRLAGELVTVWRDFTEQWHYTVEHYRKVGELRLRVTVAGRGGRDVIAPFAVARSVRHGDSTIVNANPSIGLRADGLNLPSDRQVRRSLVAKACAEAAQRIVATAVRARIADAQVRADQLGDAGKSAEAMEARVDAALLTEALSPGEGRRMLAALGARP